MEEKSTRDRFGSRELWESLEEMARGRIQEFVQTLLEEEVTALVGRAKSERREAVDAPAVVLLLLEHDGPSAVLRTARRFSCPKK